MKRLALILAVSTLTACGFSPVYGNSGGSFSQNGSIAIEEIDGRTGHLLRKALLQELAAGLPGVEKGVLTVTVSDRLQRLALQPDGAASRTDVIADSEYVLAIADTAISGSISAETSFNVPDAPYGDVAAQSAAVGRVTTLLARRMVDDMRIKLSSQTATGIAPE